MQNSLIEDVGRELWGDPTEEGAEWIRWGNRGSREVNPETGRWHDFEHNQSGDVIQMLMFYEPSTFRTVPDATAWIKQTFGVDYERPKATNGAGEIFDHLKLEYLYTDEAGAPLFYVGRFEPPGEGKTFKQRKHDDVYRKGGMKGVRLVLYNLPEVLAAKARGEPIFVVEGEKDVENLRKLGLTATTNPTGANKWRKEYNAFLQGAKVVIIPDNDDAGREHAATVRQNLPGARILELQGLPQKGDITDWLDTGGTKEKLEELLAAPATDTYSQDVWTLPTLFKHGDVDPLLSRKWLIKYLLPEVGHGLLAGQWGTYKTFVAFEIAYSVMTGNAFASRFKVKRRSGVFLIAAEGASEVAVRLEALAREKCGGHRQPFMWCEETPRLLESDATTKLIAMIKAADAEMRADHGVPIGLVVIDTMIIAAGYTKDGQEQDAAANAQVQLVVQLIAQACGVFVLGVDHFGKSMETGTRGSSVKETNADVVIALLGKEQDGRVTDPRLNVRKIRGARAGFEIGFTTTVVELGKDEDGDPIDTLVILWGDGTTAPRGEKWPRHLKLLERCLVEVISECGEPLTLPSGVTTPRAAHTSAVRALFDERYPTNGDSDEKRQHARVAAWSRHLKDAQAAGLIDIYNAEQRQYVWIR
jgi:hypothetical protein